MSVSTVEIRVNTVGNLKCVSLCVGFHNAPYRPVKEAPPTVLSSRSNVFDDDEFDVFSREKVDMKRVWRGRR